MSSRIPGAGQGGRRRAGIGGFNLLPHRQRDARRARRLCLIEWLGAVLTGCVAVLAVVGWQASGRVRLDAQRASAEHALAQRGGPLAEHAALMRAESDRRQRVARAASLSQPMTHLLDLLDALSVASGDGVVVQQLRQREYETELRAVSNRQVASAAWLARLNSIRGVKAAELNGLRRAARAGSSAAASETALVELAARLRWDDPLEKNATLPTSSTKRSPQADKTRGAG